MSEPRTETGREAVRLRGLFGGETEERASEWVRKIEAEAERSAGTAPLDVEAMEALQAAAWDVLKEWYEFGPSGDQSMLDSHRRLAEVLYRLTSEPASGPARCRR